MVFDSHVGIAEDSTVTSQPKNRRPTWYETNVARFHLEKQLEHYQIGFVQHSVFFKVIQAVSRSRSGHILLHVAIQRTSNLNVSRMAVKTKERNDQRKIPLGNYFW